tara:strand:+ start:9531 stop:10607 length:1077 start_codon:yes stop_codon:yes gene_type:complete
MQLTLNKNQLIHLIQEPEKMVSIYDLEYSTPEILNISRLKKNKTFLYYKGKKQVKDGKTLSRIKKLVIPPAWSNVNIASIDNAHIQATGRDNKNRKQYKYHTTWNLLKNSTKFSKMLEFADVLPKLRTQVEKDLLQTNFNKTKVIAIVIKLLEESHIRIGNSCYTKRNKTYGLSTLRTRHLNLFKDKFNLEFVGKRGKKHHITIRNKKLLKLINQCEEIPGWELFQYYDENNEKHTINSTLINDYIHRICGDIFSAKDFRTWAGSLIAFQTLKDIESNTDKSKHIIQTVKNVAKSLNNTPSVSRKYYIHPHIIESYNNGTIAQYFDMADNLPETNQTQLQPDEKALKALIKTYKPVIK